MKVGEMEVPTFVVSRALLLAAPESRAERDEGGPTSHYPLYCGPAFVVTTTAGRQEWPVYDPRFMESPQVRRTRIATHEP